MREHTELAVPTQVCYLCVSPDSCNPGYFTGSLWKTKWGDAMDGGPPETFGEERTCRRFRLSDPGVTTYIIAAGEALSHAC